MNNLVIGTNPDSAGLGDILVMTPLCKRFPNTIVELTPKTVKQFGCLFDGIANVVEKENPTLTKNVGNDHFAKRKLRGVGASTEDYLPYIKITQEEKDWAINEIKEYENPIIFVPNTSKRWKNIREFNPSKWNEILEEIIKTRTVLQFGLSDNFTNFNNVVQFKDIQIRKTAAIYSIVKEYVGVNTGDMHLMVAVGGNVHVLTPQSNTQFKRQWWEYDEPIGKYVLFENYKNILKGLI